MPASQWIVETSVSPTASLHSNRLHWSARPLPTHTMSSVYDAARTATDKSELHNTQHSTCFHAASCDWPCGCRCFPLSGHTAVTELIAECGHLNSTDTSDNCSTACSEAMAGASRQLGCCLHGLLAGSGHEALLHLAMWQWCQQQDGPGQPCTHCSGAAATAAMCGQLGLGLAVLVAAALTGSV